MLIVDETMKDTTQSNPNKLLDLSVPECEQWPGIILLKVTATRLYWSQSFRIPLIADCMACNGFEAVTFNPHFCDNLVPGSDQASDHLYRRDLF